MRLKRSKGGSLMNEGHSMNQKNLNYEIETILPRLGRLGQRS